MSNLNITRKTGALFMTRVHPYVERALACETMHEMSYS